MRSWLNPLLVASLSISLTNVSGCFFSDVERRSFILDQNLKVELNKCQELKIKNFLHFSNVTCVARDSSKVLTEIKNGVIIIYGASLGKTEIIIRAKYAQPQIITVTVVENSDINVSSEDSLLRILNAKNCSPKIKATIKKEIDDLNSRDSRDPEVSSLRKHIECLLSLPWDDIQKPKPFNFAKAKEIFDKKIYGMTKVKNLVLAKLAEWHHLEKENTKNKNVKGQIVCLVGPPGTGKTAIAKAIAEILGVPLEKISCAGVSHPSDLIGTSKTFINATLGAVAKALIKAKVKNPLILLNEVDKLGVSSEGSAKNALTEVLDPAENSQFCDLYLGSDYEIDLSQATFIINANDKSKIPEHLLDRMTIINVEGYSVKEQLEISKNYIIPEINQNKAIKSDWIQYSDEIINYIINTHNKDQKGIRNLKRLFNDIVSFCLVEHYKNFPDQPIAQAEKIILNEDLVDEYLK